MASRLWQYKPRQESSRCCWLYTKIGSAITRTIGMACTTNRDGPILQRAFCRTKKADWADLAGLPVLLAQVVDMPSFSTISLYLLRTVTSVTLAVRAISSWVRR